MLSYNKSEIKKQISTEDIFQLLTEWGGDPIPTSFGIVSATICHNPPGEGHHKLYYYNNSQLFQCYSGCEEPTFDIYQMIIKIAHIQWNEEYDLNAAVRWLARRFGVAGTLDDGTEGEQTEDWKMFANYSRIQEITLDEKQEITLKEYDKEILNRFNYNVKIDSWLQEGITEEIIRYNQIGYYPGGEQITIPHFDINNRLVGIRGRTLIQEEANLYGKYRPLKINKVLYNHPLGFNLYNLNNSAGRIKVIKRAIVFESEKSCMKFQSYFGIENDITVACCGSNLSNYQMQLLLDLGVQEVVIGFDRQYEELGTADSHLWAKKLTKINDKFNKNIQISFLWDKEKLLGWKDSPVDQGPQVFLELFKKRIIL